jgi:hypothetical protein
MSAIEVAAMVKLKFDTELTDWPSDVATSFSSENPSPKVRSCMPSNCVTF